MWSFRLYRIICRIYQLLWEWETIQFPEAFFRSPVSVPLTFLSGIHRLLAKCSPIVQSWEPSQPSLGRQFSTVIYLGIANFSLGKITTIPSHRAWSYSASPRLRIYFIPRYFWLAWRPTSRGARSYLLNHFSEIPNPVSKRGEHLTFSKSSSNSRGFLLH